MVTICLPAAVAMEVWQERVAAPSTWTVQAPQSPIPQPYFVPVMLSRSRSTQSKGISGSASTVCWRLLISSVTRAIVDSWFKVHAPREVFAIGLQEITLELQGSL